MAHAAVGDCEQIRAGRIGQPVNTATSAAYLAAAAWVWHRSARRRAVWVPVLAWIGLGSIAYHGPGTKPGKVLHDSALIGLVGGAVAGGLVPTVPNRRAAGVAALGTAALVLHAATRTGRRGCRPDSLWQGHGAWHLLSAAAIALWADGEGKR